MVLLRKLKVLECYTDIQYRNVTILVYSERESVNWCSVDNSV